MANWFQRRRATAAPTALPSAWRYLGPTSDEAITAAATRVTTEKIKRDQAHGVAPDNSWYREAWFMYDQVGELRYVSNAIASRMGQATLYVEKNGQRLDEEDPILALITPEMVEAMGLNIFICGDVSLVGIDNAPAEALDEPGSSIPAEAQTNTTWLVVSAEEIQRSQSVITIRGEQYKEDDVFILRVWDPHPNKHQNADSSVRSALPVLRELVGLTQHVSAQIDSRLAGAGVYWIPNSILNSNVQQPAEGGDAQQFNENPVLNAIMNAMLLPIEDRSNAAAIVPLLMGAPDEAIDKIRYDTFATPLDENLKELRDEAIRRLALNLDAPPELMLGMGGSNHWAAWLVRDEVVSVHVAPRLTLITEALTTGFYRPILKQQSPEEDVTQYVIKADTSQLVQRPNRLADASQLHAVGAIGDKTLRSAGGFTEDDAPTSQERAVATALMVAQANPQLIDNMPEIVAAVTALLDGTPATDADTISSQRAPGTLRPLVPNTSPVISIGETAPNGSQVRGNGAPLQETDARPGSRPV